MIEEELQARLEETTPERDRYELFVEESQDQDVRVRFSPPAGEGWSTAALLTVVETSLRAAAGVEASVTHLNLTRLRRRNRPTSSPCRESSGATATSSMPRPGCSAMPSSRRCCMRRRAWQRAADRNGQAASFQAPSTTTTMSRMICVRSKSLGV